MVAALGIFLSVAAGAVEPPRVVVTIKPVHALVAGVMAGIAEPTLLIEGGASPHTYSLRPSKARALNEADIVVWVGEGMETFLDKPLRTLSSDAAIVELAALDGIRLLPAREGGVWEDHGDADRGHDGDDHDDEHHDDHGSVNTHLWLDPDNARVVVDAVAAALSRADPDNTAAYAANAARVKTEIASLDREITDRLAAVRDRSFIVFHDAYRYFEDHYGLSGAGAVTVNPDRPPGPRRLSGLRHRILDGDIVCVFAEPQFAPRVVATIIEGTPAQSGTLDPIGVAIPPGPDAYGALLQGLADSMNACLTPKA